MPKPYKNLIERQGRPQKGEFLSEGGLVGPTPLVPCDKRFIKVRKNLGWYI